MLDRRQIVLQERFRSVMVKNVICYLEADRLERTGNGEEAALFHEKSDRWLKLQQRLAAALDASRAAVTLGSRLKCACRCGLYRGTSLDVPEVKSTSMLARLQALHRKASRAAATQLSPAR